MPLSAVDLLKDVQQRPRFDFQRCRVEKFFNFNRALGWNRGGTANANIRYGQMTLALIAQTVIQQLRTRLDGSYGYQLDFRFR